MKGRDWYDVAWYIREGIELDLEHLIERAKQFGAGVDVSSREALIEALDRQIDSIDFDNAKQDVVPFLRDRSELEIWSPRFFKDIIRNIKIKSL